MSVITKTFAVAGVLLAVTAAAAFAWQGAGAGSAYSKAKSLPAGNQPTSTVSGRNVTVNWSATSLPGGPAATFYVLKRYNGSGQQQTIGPGCAGSQALTSCTESAVPAGSWRYTVTPSYANWNGAESPQSSVVTVGSPSLTISPTTVTSLPQTLTGQIQNFVSGQTVQFRLDDPTSGQVLSGSITPSPVSNNGTASVSVTLPNSTTNGNHTIYAIGNQGDQASANVTVSIGCSSPGTQTLAATADGYVDQSSATTNFGSSTDLFVLSRNGNRNRRTLVNFNLPTLPPYCTITSAQLRLFSTAAATGRTIDAYRAAAVWTEAGVTWNNQPATTGSAASATSATGWVNWTVTSQVSAMYSGSNFGFVVRDSVESSPSSQQQTYNSRTNTNTPQLVITFG